VIEYMRVLRGCPVSFFSHHVTCTLVQSTHGNHAPASSFGAPPAQLLESAAFASMSLPHENIKRNKPRLAVCFFPLMLLRLLELLQWRRVTGSLCQQVSSDPVPSALCAAHPAAISGVCVCGQGVETYERVDECWLCVTLLPFVTF
jgi:hypothetical protein